MAVSSAMGPQVGVESSQPGQAMSVTRSFKAMWIWMRLIGVELDETRKGSPLRRRLSWVVGLIWFAFDLSSHLATFVFLKRNLNEESGNDLTNKVFNGLESVAFSINAISVHTALLLMLWKKWTRLWDAIERLEERHVMPASSYRSLRRCAFAGVLYIFVLNVVMALLMVRYHLAQKSHSSLLLTMDMLRVATQIYPTSGLVLFCLMGTAVNMNYGAIYEAIDVYWRRNAMATASAESTSQQLQAWKRHHALVCDVAEEITHCFGVVFLIKIVYLFVSIIGAAVFLMLNFTSVSDEAETTMYIGFLLEYVVHLLMFCHVAHQIRTQGLKISRALRKLVVVHPVHEQQINGLIDQVFKGVPDINALGFFHIGLHLFPTVVGSTITYLVILYELRSP